MIGSAGSAPAIVPWFLVAPLNRYWPAPLTVPSLLNPLPMVSAVEPWV